MTMLDGSVMPKQLNAIAASEPVSMARMNKGRVRRILKFSALSG